MGRVSKTGLALAEWCHRLRRPAWVLGSAEHTQSAAINSVHQVAIYRAPSLNCLIIASISWLGPHSRQDGQTRVSEGRLSLSTAPRQ